MTEHNQGIWDALTEEQKGALRRDYDALAEWDNAEREKLRTQLIEEGKWETYGLDANQRYFAGIIAERRKRYRELQKKYGFEPGSK